MVKRFFFLFFLLAGLAVRPASATPVFTFTFDPATYSSSVPNFTLHLLTTITNTGTTAIDAFGGDQVYYASTFLTGQHLDCCPNISASNPLNPGQSTTFDFFLMPFANIPPGTYFGLTFVSAASIGLLDVTGAEAWVNSSNLPTLVVTTTTTPEPSAFLLMATGTIGLLGMVRRRA